MAIMTSEKQDSVDSQTKREHEKYKHLLEQAKALAPLPTAVAHPCDESLVRKGVKLLSAILLIGMAGTLKLKLANRYLV
jgi:hypothetical protein